MWAVEPSSSRRHNPVQTGRLSLRILPSPFLAAESTMDFPLLLIINNFINLLLAQQPRSGILRYTLFFGKYFLTSPLLPVNIFVNPKEGGVCVG